MQVWEEELSHEAHRDGLRHYADLFQISCDERETGA